MEEVKKRKTHTSTHVKDRWNKAHYSTISIMLDKDLVAKFREKAKSDNVVIAEFFRNAIKKYLGI